MSNKKLPVKFTLKEKKPASNEHQTAATVAVTKSTAAVAAAAAATATAAVDLNSSFGSDSQQQNDSSSMRQASSSDYYVNVSFHSGSSGGRPNADAGAALETNRAASTTTKASEKAIAEKIMQTNGLCAQAQRREVTLYRDENLGFGFIAGSEKPLKIRFVTPGMINSSLKFTNLKLLHKLHIFFVLLLKMALAKISS